MKIVHGAVRLVLGCGLLAVSAGLVQAGWGSIHVPKPSLPSNPIHHGGNNNVNHGSNNNAGNNNTGAARPGAVNYQSGPSTTTYNAPNQRGPTVINNGGRLGTMQSGRIGIQF